MISLDKFVALQSELLGLEREAELEQAEQLVANINDKDLEKRGIGLTKLSIGGKTVGLFGKTVLHLVKWRGGVELPANNLSTGDIVGLSPSSGAAASTEQQIASGIITKIGPESVSVAFEETLESMDLDEDQLLKIVKLANDVTYRRLKR